MNYFLVLFFIMNVSWEGFSVTIEINVNFLLYSINILYYIKMLN